MTSEVLSVEPSSRCDLVRRTFERAQSRHGRGQLVVGMMTLIYKFTELLVPVGPDRVPPLPGEVSAGEAVELIGVTKRVCLFPELPIVFDGIGDFVQVSHAGNQASVV